MSTSPPLPYRDPALPLEQRLADLLSRMTLEEKVAQLSAAWLSEVSDEAGFSAEKAQARIGSGIGQITRPAGSTSLAPDEVARANNAVQAFLTQHTRLGIPALIHEECLSGFMARKATLFPQIIGLASTWDPDLVEKIGSVIRDQVAATGARQGLAPVLDVARDLRWGRVEETYGEDPYLVARLGSAYVRGLQGPDLRRGVAATGKHFAAHGLPESGLNWAPVHVGPRTLREVFLFPFEAAVRQAGLASLMNAYHELDGVPVAASTELLSEILRGEWGFDGVVVSDYNAVVMLADYHHVAAGKSDAACLALQAGIEIELPGTDCYGEPLLEALRLGKLDPAVVDEAARRVLRLKFRLGLFEDPFVDEAEAMQAFGRPQQRDLAQEAARKSFVLLKNEGNLLPLDPEIGSLAVIGPNAHALRALVGDYSYASFADLMEGGVSAPGERPPGSTRFPERYPPGMITLLEAIQQRVGLGTVVRYARGCDYLDRSRDGFAEAVETARASAVTVMIVGGRSGLTAECTSGELRDRAYLGLPGVQEELVEAVLGTGKPVVLVLVDGRPLAIPNLVERLPAILHAWLPGEAGGQALAAVLFGDASPGGKLPVSFPRSSGQVPVFYGRKPSGGRSYNFNDYVDLGAGPLFPFGHGLSYACFEYSDLHISPVQIHPQGEVEIRCTVKNTGERTGDEVVQLYLHDELASLTRPVKELKGFRRITLQPGQSCRLAFTLSAAQLAFYDAQMDYIIEPGQVAVMIGSSSDDIRLHGRFEIVGASEKVTRKVFFSQVRIENL